MLSKEVLQYLEQNKVDQLYKKFENCFSEIDRLSEIFLIGDLLNELELASALDKSTGIYAKLCPVVNALDSYMERILNNEESKYYQSQAKVRTQDTSIAKSTARAKVSDVRDYISDFKSYLLAAQQNIVSAQSRLKRLVIESHAKGVAGHGEVPIDNTLPEENIETQQTILEDDISNDENQKAWDS